MAVTRSVSKDEYGGEGRGSRNQGVVTSWSVMMLLGNSQEKMWVVSCWRNRVQQTRTSWCCITYVIIYRVLMLGKCGRGGIRHTI